MTLSIYSFNNQQFEHKNQLRDTAQYILNRANASVDETQAIMQKTIFGNSIGDYYTNAQLSALKASLQISLRNTSKYLKNNEKKSNKTPKLGDLINLFDDESEIEYEGELKDFQIDKNLKNIFAA